MIQNCPHCGVTLAQELKSGLSHCSHCNQVFDSSTFNVLLAAAWLVRKENLSLERLKWQLKLDDDLAIFVVTFVSEYCYSHDEFLRLLKKFNVSRTV